MPNKKMYIGGKQFTTSKEILMFPEFKAFPRSFDKDDAAATSENGRKIIKAGTIYPTNDDKAIGVVLYDCDVTDGACTGALIYEGSIKVAKIPAEPDGRAKTALPRVTWFKLG